MNERGGEGRRERKGRERKEMERGKIEGERDGEREVRGKGGGGWEHKSHDNHMITHNWDVTN